jgi:hypothetical protein
VYRALLLAAVPLVRMNSYSRRLRLLASFASLLIACFEIKGSHGFEHGRTCLNSPAQLATNPEHRKPHERRKRQTKLGATEYPNGSGERERRTSSLMSPLTSAPSESDRLPRRAFSLVMERARNYREEWGVSMDSLTRDFPDTIESVVHQTFDAIAGTLYAKNMLDPNIVQNAASTGIFGYRPTRSNRDAGRMGVELDGAQTLFPKSSKVTPEQANRHLSFLLAAKLSRNSNWEPYETIEGQFGEGVLPIKAESTTTTTTPTYRPIALYFNTLQQALVASQELKLLKRAELTEREALGLTKSSSRPPSTSFDMISIQFLGEKLPAEMRLDRADRRRYRGLSNGYVNATRGLIMIVGPSDYNSEFRPPGPVIDAVGTFQGLVAQASIEELPTVVVSPRFLSNDSPYARGSWDQSGFQRSATYGGIEPPKGPTPWVMRDFTPPIYCWVNNAGSLAQPRNGPGVDPEEIGCYFSRIALTQSVMDKGHAWHIFAAKECSDGIRKLPTTYQHIASTRSASGRPTRDVIRTILNEVGSTL